MKKPETVEEFLARGGRIEVVPQGATAADPQIEFRHPKGRKNRARYVVSPIDPLRARKA